MSERRVKEAIKVALALVIAYGIALSQGWYKPAWAGFTVTIIAMPMLSIEQSVKKAILRIIGTVPGSILGLIMIAIAPQSRFLFIALVMLVMFVCTYMMLIDKKRNYIWNVIGFTMLIIASVGGESSQSAFNQAMYRILENITGILVYTVVSFLLWPNKKEHSSYVALQNVLSTFSKVFSYDNQGLISTVNIFEKYKRITDLDNEIQNLNKEIDEDIFEEIISAKSKNEWLMSVKLFQKISSSIMNINILRKDLHQNNDLLIETEIEEMFFLFKERIDNLLQFLENTEKPPKSIPFIDLKVHKDSLSELDKQYLEGIIHEFRNLTSLIDDVEECIYQIKQPSTKKKFNTVIEEPYFKLNRYAFKKAVYVALSTLSGFLVWIYIDPPGHQQWYVMVGLNTMMIANMPSSRPQTYLPPVYVMIVAITIIYCFILPQLDSFFSLAFILFIYTFCQHYYMKGRAYITACIGLMSIGISTQQHYNFAGLANGFIFDIMYMMWLIVTGYLIDITRLEKKYIRYLHQFFRSAHYLFEHSHTKGNSLKKMLAIEDIHEIPNHLKSFQKNIDYNYYNEVEEEELEKLTIVVMRISYRLRLILEQEVEEGTKEDNTVNDLIKNVNHQLLEVSLGHHYDINKVKESVSLIYEEREKDQVTSSFELVNSFNTFYQALHSYYILKKDIPLATFKEERFA